MSQRSIHWFRKGLRLHDNPALLAACENASHLYPVFFLDPYFIKGNHYRVGVNRWRFLLETLRDLDNNLRKLDSRLFVVQGKPQDMLPKLFKEWKITRLTFEVDTEPFAVQRDEEVEQLAKALNVEIVKRVSHTLFDVEKMVCQHIGKPFVLHKSDPSEDSDSRWMPQSLCIIPICWQGPEETLAKNGGSPPLTYQRLQTLVSQMGPPPRPLEPLSAAHLTDCSTPVGDDHEKKYGVPSLADLGQKESECGPSLFPGGETVALERMERHLKKTNWICKFEKPQTEPNSLQPSTTVLSPYLKFGCLSARTFYHRLLDVYRVCKDGVSAHLQAIYSTPHQSGPLQEGDPDQSPRMIPMRRRGLEVRSHTQPPVSLHGQLLWREFFYTVAAGTPNFNRMEGNSVCIQIPWDTNPEYLAAWREGRTGYPFIDAIMTQLRQEGWIHHLARHAVACFLTRGDLWISWEEGQKVFEELLLDADWSLNAGNWMWLSASAFFYQYFRVYSPIAFGKKTDKNGDYIRKYLPKLRKFPAQYVYEPWKAPRSVQEAAGCLIGQDYPRPIVEHEVISKVNIKRMAEAYAKHKANKAASGNKSGSPQKRKSEGTGGTNKKTKTK